MVDVAQQIKSGAPALKFRLGPGEWDFQRIAPGSFLMGSPATEPGRGDGEPLPFEAKITRPFYIARTPVTQAQYIAVTGHNPGNFPGPSLPVNQIHFDQAIAFTDKLATLLGVIVTLPTEAQWEYACRAGTTTPIYSGTTIEDLRRIAWYIDNSGETPHAVGEKQPNAWGLLDMLGNVFEPCIDRIISFDALSREDPQGPRSPDRGTARGGGWMATANRCRAAARMPTNNMFGGMGIRPIIRF